MDKIKFKIVVKQNKDQQWFWHLVGRNGEVLAHSESYSSKHKALDTATAVFSAMDQATLAIE